jgi:hypothetical protein
VHKTHSAWVRKVKWSLYLITQAPSHEDVRGNGGLAPPFFTEALAGSERSPSTQWIGDWVGPEPVWMLWSKKNLLLPTEIEPQPFSPQPIAIPLCLGLKELQRKDLKLQRNYLKCCKERAQTLYIYTYIYIVACCLKAGIVESDRKLIS